MSENFRQIFIILGAPASCPSALITVRILWTKWGLICACKANICDFRSWRCRYSFFSIESFKRRIISKKTWRICSSSADLESKFMSRLLISITDREFFRFPSGIRMFFSTVATVIRTKIIRKANINATIAITFIIGWATELMGRMLISFQLAPSIVE